MDSVVIQGYKSNEATALGTPLTLPRDCVRRGGNEWTLMCISANKVTTEEVRFSFIYWWKSDTSTIKY
jgi:hypothetical protein